MRTETMIACRLLLGIATMLVLAPEAMAQDLDQLYQSGRQAFQDGKVHEAIELLGGVAEANPGYKDVQVLLGQAYLVTHRHLDAKRHFERALAADPANGHAAFLLGLALYQSARYFEAAEALERAHSLAPQNPHPLIYRGLSLLRLGRPDEARAEIDTALGLAPRDPTARTALAELELAAGRFQSAEALAREVLAETPLGQAPVALEATLLLGRTVMAAGRPAEAVAMIEGAVQTGTAGSDALYLLARALLKSGDTEAGRAAMVRFKARKAFEEEVKVLEADLRSDPGDVESRLRLVRVLLDHRQIQDAMTHYTQLQKLAAGDPRVRALAAELERKP